MLAMAALARQPIVPATIQAVTQEALAACVGKLFPAEVLQGFRFPMLEDLVITSPHLPVIWNGGGTAS